MKEFYSKLEAIACDPANYPNGQRWPTERISWECLGTAERMDQLGALIADAQNRAHTGIEKQRVASWHDAIWKWMLDGRAAYLAKIQRTVS
jgi:hypothetical protein